MQTTGVFILMIAFSFSLFFISVPCARLTL